MSIDLASAKGTIPAADPTLIHDADATASRYDAAVTAWLAGEDPPRLSAAALLHTEVEHDGACYGIRVLLAGLIGVPVSAGATLMYALGRLQRDGNLDVLPLGAVWTVVAVLASAGLVALAELVRHALWHRAEAPYAYNVVVGPVPAPQEEH